MIAFDTNVLIYSLDDSAPGKRDTAAKLLLSVRDAILLWQVACEFIAATRKLRSQGFTHERAWQELDVFLGGMTLVLPTPATLLRARILHVEQAVSSWDSMLIAAALDAGVTRLYSEDIPGRVKPGGLEIINPFV